LILEMELALPERFVRTVTCCFAERGAEWLYRLPSLLAECAERWSLTILPAFPNLSYNYVAPVVCADGMRAVLKVGMPDAELHTQIPVLRWYNGRNCVRLLAADEERGLALLERLVPGTTLTGLADDAHDAKATSIAASVMRGLWRPAPPEHGLPRIEDWLEGLQRLRQHFDGGVGPFPVALVEEAETLTAELLASAAAPVLLHGDLHHDNILAAERQPWLAIDPKGVVGEPAYEVGALLRNLWQDRHTLSNPARTLARRVDQLAEELDLDRARVRGWALAQGVLSAWWGIEDNEDCWHAAIAEAQVLAAIPKC
jgi:streptomycin 6-kinase